MTKDFFKQKADSYEKVNYRIKNVDNIANSMLRCIQFDQSMNIMDFGSGTGLLLERLACSVNSITAVDISVAMNEQLVKKRDDLGCELEIVEIDLSISTLERKFDGIVSSMTMHHVKDTELMFSKFYSMLNDHGFIAIADLDIEDGTFHREDTGVFHTGFKRKDLIMLAKKMGFKDVKVITASTAKKPQGNYPVFLLTALK